MNAVAESVLLDNWKSYKVFLPKGRMKLHNQSEFTQFLFSPGEKLTIRRHKSGGSETLAANEAWMLELHEGRHYLVLQDKALKYEIITVNHTVLVVRDEATDEKTFFARDRCWDDYLTTSRETIL